MRKLIKEIIKSIYYIFPRFLRYEYIDSLHYYRNTLVKVYDKARGSANEVDIDERKVLEVKLVEDIECLDTDVKLLSHKVGNYSKISSPRLYLDNIECLRSPIESNLPDVKVTSLFGAHVLGGTDAVISNGNMYHNELKCMSPIHDMKRPDIFIKNIGDKHFDYEVITNSSRVLEGISISLLKEHTSNYYHCMTEVIPKLIEIKSIVSDSADGVKILIDDYMPEQCVRIIELILANSRLSNYLIVRVSKAELIYCENLIYCTPIWISLDNTTHLPSPTNEFFLSVDSLIGVKDEVSKCIKYNEVSHRISNRRIYLQRSNSKLRKITNIIEVERLLYKYGFDFVNTGSMSFDEQHRLFSNADLIFGVSGASFTNILFMRPGSQAVMLSPSAQCTNYFIFQPLADASNVELSHLLTVPQGESSSLHEDASVNIEELETYLSKRIGL
ncbi:glycosyltransferase family 61 protein [Vibrio crassostreae]|nr:glycosyltransferase family 61 protein [Vibrio crassostreae]CAK2564250.1 Capsular biosynthesis protein [Vibrio crassostreae]CAK2564503.1 Capsular biosynthesis protein [Vibrio crassostreae]CAK2577268.1 Capsular biosynthesis protein [Vibrio crassostreae]CAK2577292.1 Capsular biosynthesis protein [Vibrio crassostreae]CAK2577573.1 Capsular biosynthesis protein [Vibrio crassostreae]